MANTHYALNRQIRGAGDVLEAGASANVRANQLGDINKTHQSKALNPPTVHPVCFSMSLGGPTPVHQSRTTPELTEQDREQG